MSSKHLAILEFVLALRKFPQQAFEQPVEILSFLQNNPVMPETLRPYLSWDRQHYTRNLIDKTPLFELMAMCCEPGQVSSVHNHRDQNCWMMTPTGRLRVENFRTLAQDIDAGTCELAPDETVEMDTDRPCAVDPKEPVHRVVNPKEWNQRAVSLHIYSRPFDTCVVYSPEQRSCGVIKLHYNTAFGRPVRTP
jgi:cysteine dioxygenase